ncbi:monovalent cation/H(+) antiporter subunit G [Nitrincola tapanii]|uniref:Monovalent cation/H(+) antiporter subunit G n=1 Tax=Nitrincola tapanii TaxID=1708751 RepID=A0A5A9W0C6_9GAMM|nr:monovalent cation/H(+) antiporter subunit G [Nitrincola tapanii]KAA0874210.1 monovalent cation/H(+) antiporter subunit G [Nitrincola tapanii]
MIDWLIKILMLASAAFMLLAAVGIVRLPDLLTRMHATTKAGALGVALMMLAVALHFADSVVSAKTLAVILFIFITAPIAAHVIGRAGYFTGLPLCEQTIKDELVDCYDEKSHRLLSGLETEEELEAYRQNLDMKPRIRTKAQRLE